MKLLKRYINLTWLEWMECQISYRTGAISTFMCSAFLTVILSSLSFLLLCLLCYWKDSDSQHIFKYSSKWLCNIRKQYDITVAHQFRTSFFFFFFFTSERRVKKNKKKLSRPISEHERNQETHQGNQKKFAEIRLL